MALTPAQETAASTLDRCCCVVSIPGSGKTTVITRKIANILRARPGRSVTAVTFTAEAARELRERTVKIVGGHAADNLKTGTFHSLAIRAIRSLKHEAANRRIAPDGTAKQYFARAVSLVTDSDKVSDYEMTWLDTCRMSAAGDYGSDNDSPIRREAVSVYHRMMKSAGLVDFGELMQIGLQLAEDGHMLFGGEGDHLLVDEAQDIDKLQLRLILEHHANGMLVDMVGDDDQSIYAFRMGLGMEGMRKFEQQSQALRITLDTNFRCRQEILDWAGAVVVQNGSQRIQKHLKAGRGAGGSIRLLEAPHSDVEEERIANEVAEIWKKRRGTVAIIARQNHFLQTYQLHLEKRGVAVKRLSGASIWDEGPVCMFTALLQCIERWSSPAGFEQFLYWMEVRADAIERIGKTLGRSMLQNLQGTQAGSTARDLGESGRRFAMASEAVVAWRSALAHSKTDADINRVITQVADWCVEYANRVNERGEPLKSRTFERLKSQSLIPAVAKFLKGFKGSISSRMIAISRLEDSGDKDPFAVRLASMHGSKGLEFDHVYVVGCDHSTIPGQSTGEREIEEERRLLYVAMTRAKDYLTVSYSKAIAKQARDGEVRVKHTAACSFLRVDGMLPPTPIAVG